MDLASFSFENEEVAPTVVLFLDLLKLLSTALCSVLKEGSSGTVKTLTLLLTMKFYLSMKGLALKLDYC